MTVIASGTENYRLPGVPEHAELHLLLSMLTPLARLERAPTYKGQQEKNQRRETIGWELFND